MARTTEFNGCVVPLLLAFIIGVSVLVYLTSGDIGNDDNPTEPTPTVEAGI